MNDDTVPNLEASPLAVLARVDQVCDRFEAAWPQAGQSAPRPRIEDYLGETAEPERSQLLTQLLAVELEYRRAAGEDPLLWDYQARFPDHAEVIQRVFSTLDTVSPEAAAPGSPTDTALLSGGLFPPGYEILDKLGWGGQADVYRARQQRAERLVALKMLREDGHTEPGQLERFRREASALGRLQHPNIVQVFEVGEHQGKPFFSLEYCSGGNLDQYLRGTPLPPREAAALIETLARTMHAAHQQQVVHRDLKPANVLLASGGREPPEHPQRLLSGGSRPPLADFVPKVTDFGLAKRLDDVAGPSVSGAIMGTPSYMAPEQAQGRSKEAGPAADVYALGAILYECVTGRPPFKAPTQFETLLQVLNEEPVPPRKLQPKMPRDLETICLKCLAKERACRYATAEELAEDLRRFLEGKPIEARPVGRLERARMWARRKPVAAGLLALGLLLGTALPAYFAIKPRNAIPTRSELVHNPKLLLAWIDHMEPNEAAAALVEAMAMMHDSEARQNLAWCLFRVTPRMEPEDAAATLTRAMANTIESPLVLHILAKVVASVAARLEHKDATRVCSEAAAILWKAMSKTNDPFDQRELEQGLSVLAKVEGYKDKPVKLKKALSMLELVSIILCAFLFIGGGITALWKSRIPDTKIEGVPARVMCLLLVLAIPLAFLAYFFSDPIVKTLGIPPNPRGVQPMVVFCVPLLTCSLLAVIVGFVFAKKTAEPAGAGAGGGACPPEAQGRRYSHAGHGQDA
jgi:serine/threonine protein kinase